MINDSQARPPFSPISRDQGKDFLAVTTWCPIQIAPRAPGVVRVDHQCDHSWTINIIGEGISTTSSWGAKVVWLIKGKKGIYEEIRVVGEITVDFGEADENKFMDERNVIRVNKYHPKWPYTWSLSFIMSPSLH